MNNYEIVKETLYSQKYGLLRLIYVDKEIFFCGRDVASAMGFLDPRKAVSLHCKNIRKELHFTSSGNQFLNFIDIKDVLCLYKHSKSDNACDYIISLKDAQEVFIKRIALMTEQEETADSMSCEVDVNDTETEKALDNFAKTVKELYENHGIFVSIEGIYLDEGDERYRLV